MYKFHKIISGSFFPTRIVQSRHGTIDQYPFTHKYLNASLKALPIIITSGTFKINGNLFRNSFELYSKVKTINFKYIELYNSKGESGNGKYILSTNY